MWARPSVAQCRAVDLCSLQISISCTCSSSLSKSQDEHVTTSVNLAPNSECYIKQQEKQAPKQRTNTLALQAQQNPKEGILSWTQSTTLSSQNSKLKVPQVNPVIRPTCDPEKQETHAKPLYDLVSHDQIGNKSPDISRAPTCDKSQDLICFGQARSLLINKWQIIGTIRNQ